jgi:hypothetical protein
MAHDVFISYSAEDKPTADAVCATLEARRIRCWIAPRDILPGVSYAEALIDAIGQSRLMVLVFSSHSNKSPHVMREVERAASNGIAILPLRIEDVTPSKSMGYFISRTHWLDALTPPLEKHLQQLADTVQLLLAKAGRAAPVGEEPGAPVSARTAEAAVDVGMGRPPPSQGVLEVAKRWGGRPMVLLALGIGAVVAVTIAVLIALLSGAGEGDSGLAAGGPTGNPGTLWVSSIPQSGRVYVAPRGSREADYPGPSIPDQSYLKGTTPLEIEIAPGDYDVVVIIDTGEDREFEGDGAKNMFISMDAADNVVRRGSLYEILEVADEQETVIALFQVVDEPYSALLDSLPDEWLFDFNEEKVTRLLRREGVSEAEIPTVLEILHKGGKVALRHTKDPTMVIEWKDYGLRVFEMSPPPE